MIGTKKLSMIRKELASALATTQSDPIAWLESRISNGARKESAAGDGSEVAATLAGGAIYTAVPGETLSVDLGSGGGSSPLIVEAAGGWPCALDITLAAVVQCLDECGAWRSGA